MTNREYTTENKIAEYLGDITIASGDTYNAIMATQSYVENYTERIFKADSVASSRLYDGNGRQAITIDDCISVTKVEIGNNYYGDSFTELVNTGDTPEYYLLPNNYNYLNVPITKVGARNHYFINGNANHRITAKWGYSATVPKDIEFVATVLVAGILNQARQGGDQIKSEKIGNYQVTYNTENGEDSFSDFKQALSILESYKKLNI
jgi:hypothetical protein